MANLRLRSKVLFPAIVVGDNGISVTKASGTYTFSWNITRLAAVATIADTTNTLVAVQNASSGIANYITFANFTTQLNTAAFASISGDATATSGGVLTVGVNKITYAKMAQATAWTLVGNPSASTANKQDFTIGGLTHKGSPAGTDLLLLQDQAATGALKYASIAEVAGAVVSGVSSINGLSGAVTRPFVPTCRATLTTGVPVSGSDVTGATTVYLTATGGMYVPAYTGSAWTDVDISTDLSLALDSNNAHTNYHQSGKNYDLYVAYVSGTTYFGTGPKWNDGAVAGSDTARGTGAASTEIETYKGIPVNKNSMTLRFGSASGNTVTVPARQATLIGTFRTTADGTTEDSAVKRFLSNAWNTAPVEMLRVDTTDSWTYSTGAWHQANASAANQIEWVHCLAGRALRAEVQGFVINSTALFQNMAVGVGIDSITVNSAGRVRKVNADNNRLVGCDAFYNGYPGLGYHRATWLEMGAGADVQTWYGDAGLGINGVPPVQTGISGRTHN